jgi:hypothetical protein
LKQSGWCGIKKWLKNLFSENSDVSCMRVMAMMGLIFAGYLAIIGKDACVGIFVTAAFSAKLGQKWVETKSTETTKKTESLSE